MFSDALFALMPPVIVLAFHAARLLLLPAMYRADMFMSAAGGAAIAWMYFILWRR